MSAITHARLRRLAAECRLTLLGVTTAEPFDGLAELLVERIRAGHMDGLDWFTEERARFSADPRNLHPTARSIVSVGLPYWQPDIAPPDDGVPRGRISRYAWGRDYHKTLRSRMRNLHARLEAELGLPIEARALVDTARIVDRAAAARSGLGWYGKNTMILVPGHGSWVMLGELVLDIEVEPLPALRPKCGRCTRCLDACPTGALVDAYRLDTPRCISYLTIELRGPIPRDLRPLMGNWVFGCDICQEVCPYTGAAAPSDDPDVRPERIEHAFPSLHWLLTMSEEEFREVYRGRAVLRAKRSGLARNAAVALGNIGSDADLGLLQEVAATHDIPLVRGHAAWAMARIDAVAADPALRRLHDREPDPAVRAEIAATLDDPPPARRRDAA
ncbi:tRNA epoxyqueuosine(34) reductase QueG [Sphaerobacter sp.]|uniref:tRNA epoxyqueuosine(34) reductase QueG n=1 Tax=Sphaerobacter sp. TaxID=2099654 RepID=UPI001DCC7789|nr:tRNA epoxyqueuosine(34) reductase QueG [Sphaerobacter sp.]MBX5444293.1 tRNA epoxyqueuosine(34) reductase QueG [Sphaerobacter sp.]